MASRGIDLETAERFQLGFDGQRLVIPYLTPAGPSHLKRRCLSDHNCKEQGHEKYLGTAGAPTRLFNAQTLVTADVCVIVEGELDAITAEQHNVPAVAYPGASTWSNRANRHWPYCFDSVDDIVIVADGDEPGKKAAETVASSLRKTVHGEVRIVPMPDGEDVNSFLLSRGSGAFLQLLDWM